MIEYVGQQLGNYRLLHLLGQGGFASVYAGEHVYLKTRAAIKVLHMETIDQRHNDFLNEAQMLAHLVHPHIVRILEFGIEGNIPFLVMDYAANGSFRNIYPKGTRLPLEAVVSYVKQLAAALHYAHVQNVIHRDVKPGNVLLGEHNEALLSDFGLATMAHHSNSSTPQGIIQGTAPYMAPEQISGQPCPASDQYALATVAYEWLCGEHPFHGSFTALLAQQMTATPPPFSAHGAILPADVEEVIMIALAKDHSVRFSSVEAFAHALELASRPEDNQDTIPTQTEHQPALLHPQTLPIVSLPPDLQSTSQMNTPSYIKKQDEQLNEI